MGISLFVNKPEKSNEAISLVISDIKKRIEDIFEFFSEDDIYNIRYEITSFDQNYINILVTISLKQQPISNPGDKPNSNSIENIQKPKTYTITIGINSKKINFTKRESFNLNDEDDDQYLLFMSKLISMITSRGRETSIKDLIDQLSEYFNIINNSYKISYYSNPFQAGQINYTYISGNPFQVGSYTVSNLYTGESYHSFEVQPNYGYEFVNWTDNKGNTIDNTSFECSISENTTYIANFKKCKYSLSIDQYNSIVGTLSGAGLYSYNDIVKVSATPESNQYRFYCWKEYNEDTNEYNEIKPHKSSYSFRIQKDTHLLAYFISSNTGLLTDGTSPTYDIEDPEAEEINS